MNVITLFHGTNLQSANNITHEGFKVPTDSTTRLIPTQTGDGTYFSTSEEVALSYAHTRMFRQNDQGAVLKCTLLEVEFNNFAAITQDNWDNQERGVAYRGHVDPVYCCRVAPDSEKSTEVFLPKSYLAEKLNQGEFRVQSFTTYTEHKWQKFLTAED
jgi:hypothetical protein